MRPVGGPETRVRTTSPEEPERVEDPKAPPPEGSDAPKADDKPAPTNESSSAAPTVESSREAKERIEGDAPAAFRRAAIEAKLDRTGDGDDVEPRPGVGAIAQRPQRAPVVRKAEPGAGADPSGEPDRSKIGSALGKDPPQLFWNNYALDMTIARGREQGGISDKEMSENAGLAKKFTEAQGDARPTISATGLADLVKASGVDYARQDPSQVVAATNFIGQAKDSADFQKRVEKSLDGFRVLDKIGMPKLTQQEAASMVVESTHLSAGVMLDKEMRDPAKRAKGLQQLATAVNQGGESELKVGRYNVELKVNDQNQVVSGEAKIPGFWSKLGGVLKVAGKVALTVASVVPSPVMPFAIAANGIINAATAIKNKNWLGAAAGVAGAFAGGVTAFAGEALRSAGKVASLVSRGAGGLEATLKGVQAKSGSGILSGVAGIAGSAAGFLSNGASGVARALDGTSNRLQQAASAMVIGESIAKKDVLGAVGGGAGVAGALTSNARAQAGLSLASSSVRVTKAIQARDWDGAVLAGAGITAGINGLQRTSSRAAKPSFPEPPSGPVDWDQIGTKIEIEGPPLLASKPLPGIDGLATLPNAVPSGLVSRWREEADKPVAIPPRNKARAPKGAPSGAPPIDTSSLANLNSTLRAQANAAIAAHKDDPDLALNLTALANDPAFLNLGDRAKAGLIDAMAKGTWSDRQTLRNIASAPGLARLSDDDKERLIRYVGGTSDNSLQARAAMPQFFDRPSFQQATPERQAQLLRSFLKSGVGDVFLVGSQWSGGQNDARATVPYHLTEIGADPRGQGLNREGPATTHLLEIDGRSIPIVAADKPADAKDWLLDADTVARGIARMPAEARSQIRIAYINPAQERNAFMTADSEGKLNVYPTTNPTDERFADRSLVHEGGHFVSYVTMGTDLTTPAWQQWRTAMKSDVVGASGYAHTNPWEDFAEAYELYKQVRGTPREAELRRLMPERFKILDKRVKP